MKKLPHQIKLTSCFCIMIRSLLVTLITAVASVAFATSLPKLKVSDNHRFLVTESGEPFFWLGDTAWEIFHRSSREDADRYLENRAKNGFTVIQAVALAEMDDLNGRNYYGHRALSDKDPTKPDVKDGPDNDYWDHVDYIVAKANSLGLYIAFLPTWGDKWNKKWGVGPEIFTPTNAETYGRWLGARYRDAGVVWVLGGDRPIENDVQRKLSVPWPVVFARETAAHISSRFIHLADMVRRSGGKVRLGSTSTCGRMDSCGVHRSLRPNSRGLRTHTDQTGARW